MAYKIDNLAWDKMKGLLPAIIQDAKSNVILMHAYMNQEALQKTIETEWVTFYSRSKKTLWVKGETSGNKLRLVDIATDCDGDTLLVKANPTGAICHTGSSTCFGEIDLSDWDFIQKLENIISQRQQSPRKDSYTSKLFQQGTNRIAQKVGEEGVEVAMAAIEKNNTEFCAEVADLLFHILVLLKSKNLALTDVIQILKKRQS